MRKSESFRLLWYMLAVLLLILAPTQLWQGEPIWYADFARRLQVLAVAGAYGLSMLLLPLLVRHQDRPWLLRLAVPLAFLAGAYLAVLVITPTYSRGVLLASSSLFGIVLVLPLLFARFLTVASTVAGAGVLALLLLGLLSDRGDAGPSPVVLPEGDFILSSHHLIEVARYLDLFPTVRGGGIERIGEDLLLVTGQGEFSRVRLMGDSIAVLPVGLHAPLNRDEFLRATDASIRQQDFRVSGLLVRETAAGSHIVVAHHYWYDDQECYVMRFSDTTVDGAALGSQSVAGEGGIPAWRTLHETRPCLPMKDLGSPFAGLESGGAMAPLGDSAILVTVGDHEFDGVNASMGIAQLMEYDYGKTLVLPLNGSPPRIFTLGHRNPQGLVIAPTGEIWSTEQGPEGGDELNLLVEGANYGWPLQTYGTQYGRLGWPLIDESASVDRFTGPRFSWVPSVAITNLIAVRGDGFDQWGGDLLAASLRAGSLFRIRWEEDRVVYVEPLVVERRIRDLVEMSDGRLVLWADGSLLVLTAVEDFQPPTDGSPPLL